MFFCRKAGLKVAIRITGKYRAVLVNRHVTQLYHIGNQAKFYLIG